MAVIGEMHYLTIGNDTYSIPVNGGGGGTVTSVRVQATSPIQSSSSSEQTVSLNTTISLADGYGDTKRIISAIKSREDFKDEMLDEDYTDDGSEDFYDPKQLLG